MDESQAEATIAKLTKELAEERRAKNLAYADRSRNVQLLACALSKCGHQGGFRDQTSEWPVLAMRLSRSDDMVLPFPDQSGRTFARDEIAFHIARGDFLGEPEAIINMFGPYPHSWEFVDSLKGKSDEEKDEIYRRDSVQRAASMKAAMERGFE